MRTHRIIYTLIFSFIFLFQYYSQNKIAKDPITGEKIVTSNFMSRWVYYENKEGKTKFEILWTVDGLPNTVFPAKSEILIKLENGEIVKLSTTAETHPKPIAQYGVVSTNYNFETELDKATIKKLSLSKPVLVRFPELKTVNSDFTTAHPWGKKFFKAIYKGAKFLVENT